MIYIIRHQEGHASDNCLSEKGLKNTQKIAKRFKMFNDISCFFKTVYTVQPYDYKHVRPIQTASLLCTYMNSEQDRLSVRTCQNAQEITDDLIKSCALPCYDVIMVWNHGDMESLVRTLIGKPEWKMKWPPDNYDGCLVVDSDTVRFYSRYFSKLQWTNLISCLH